MTSCDFRREPAPAAMKAPIVLSLLICGCMAQPEPITETTSETLLAGGMPELPSATGTGALTPWGGTDATRWRPEAIMANASSRALNDAWSRADVDDAIVAMPIRMLE